MESLFLNACAEGLTSIVSKYIRKGLDLNVVDWQTGCTGLMKACSSESYEIIKMLIEAGADINKPDRFGQNALHYAIKTNNEKICKLLCVNKIDSKQASKVSQVLPKDFSIKGSNELKPGFVETNYITQLNNIKKYESPALLLDADEPRCTEDRIFNLILRYDDLALSDLESIGDETTGAGVYKKSKKKKKKGKKSGKKSKSGKKKKKKK